VRTEVGQEPITKYLEGGRAGPVAENKEENKEEDDDGELDLSNPDVAEAVANGSLITGGRFVSRLLMTASVLSQRMLCLCLCRSDDAPPAVEREIGAGEGAGDASEGDGEAGEGEAGEGAGKAGEDESGDEGENDGEDDDGEDDDSEDDGDRDREWQ
jgi:hypothetical protein